MPDYDDMLAAHVQFEMARWSDEAWQETVTEEVTAAFEWLDSVPVSAIVEKETVVWFVDAYVRQFEMTPEVTETITELVQGLRETVASSDATVADLVRKDDYDRFVQIVVGMHDARRAITHQITSSEVYSGLIAHVLYQGIKNYVVSDGGIARRVPGASSLMKLGKGAISSAAPNLEKTVDRQLTSFVNANIQDSIRDSEAYLDSVLNAELLGAVADEVWQSNSTARVSDAAGLLSQDVLPDLTAATHEALSHLRQNEMVSEMMARGVDELMERLADRSVGEVLGSVGITVGDVAQVIAEFGRPVLARAKEDGFLEARVQARLAAFYEQYAG